MRLTGFILALTLSGCASPTQTPTATWLDRVPTPDPSLMQRAVVSRSDDSVTLRPVSPRGAAVGVSYAFDMPHCGIKSPIDVDGSFWDAVGVDPMSVEFDGRPGAIRLTSADIATFTSSDGRNLDLVRHVGVKTFHYCQ